MIQETLPLPKNNSFQTGTPWRPVVTYLLFFIISRATVSAPIMTAPCKSGVAEKTVGTKAAKAGPRPQRSSDTDNKTIMNEEKKDSEKNPEAGGNGANVTKKDRPSYRSRIDSYAISFRTVMYNWMLVNFPDEVRQRKSGPSQSQPSKPGKKKPRNGVKRSPEPTMKQYLGWLNSLVNRDEKSAVNSSTKMYWKRFCKQKQNKKMVASWMAFARDVRTADGLLKFRPAFKHVNVSISPGTQLHPLISFPSTAEFKDKTNATLGRRDDIAVAPTKRPRQSIQGEDDDGSGEGSGVAKKARKERTA